MMEGWKTGSRVVATVVASAALQGCHAREGGSVPEWTHRTIAVGRGDSMHVVHRRLDASRTLAFVPGLGDTWQSYLALVAELPDSFGIVLFDPLGHGASTKREGANGPGRQAEALAAALDSLAAEPYAIIGHSYGGVIAQYYGRNRPELPTAILMAAGTTLGTNPAAAEFRTLAASMPDTVPDEVLELQRESFSGDVPDAVVRPYIDASRDTPGHVWRDVIDTLLLSDTRSFLSGFRPRTLLVMPDNDKVAGTAFMDEIVAALPAADTVRIPSTSHGMHWERPDTVASVILSFLGAGR
jgi:3-oxoadipate enol-lactonase